MLSKVVTIHFIYKAKARIEIITVRGRSCLSRLPKYLPPTPLPARQVCTPRLCWGEDRLARRRGGWGGSIFWKTRDIGLPSYSKNLSTLRRVWKKGIFYEGSCVLNRREYCWLTGSKSVNTIKYWMFFKNFGIFDKYCRNPDPKLRIMDSDLGGQN